MIGWLRRRFARPAPAVASLLADLHAAAAASGRPRGLRWVSVEPAGEMRVVGRVAVVPVVVQFEPVPWSDMEGVEAATVPRPAVAVFRFARGRWRADPKPVFNLPAEVVLAKLASG